MKTSSRLLISMKPAFSRSYESLSQRLPALERIQMQPL